MSLIAIGLSGLRAAQSGLATTGHNIANVNTAGFSRQQVVQTPALAQFSGAGYLGQGVGVSSVRRVYSDFLAQSLRDSTASSSGAASYSTEASRLDGVLADASSNLSTGIDAFFAAVQSTANNPSDTATRQTLLSTARTLAARVNDLGSRLTSQGADVDQQIDDNVAQVNTLARQIATLNKQIVNDGRDPTNNQIPNDLLDQRDSLVQQIAAAVGGSSLAQSDGSVSVFVGSGQPIVVGGTVNALSTVPDDQDPSKKQLAVTVNGQLARVQTSQVTQGTIGGLLRFRDDVLAPAQDRLGQVVLGLGSALNAQNALGQDANGNPGGPLFTLGQPTVAGRASNSPGSGLSVAVTDASQLEATRYRLDYDGTNYTLTNLADASTRTFGSLPQTVDGLKIATSGALAAGDRFTISAVAPAARDFAVATTDPARIATAAPVALSIGASNSGTARADTLTVLPASPLPANLRDPVNVVFHVTGSTTTYDLVDASSGTAISAGNAYSAGAAIAAHGWSLTLTGTPADGDAFTVGPNTAGTGDNRNALLLAGVQQQAVTKLGSAQDDYNGLVGLVGNQANEASALKTSEDSLLTQAQDDRDAVSGVNLDEEAANLQKYQQAYQAASKSIATAQVMFQAILDIFN